MKKLHITIALIFLTIAPALAQGLVRKPFLEIGNGPVEERQMIPYENGNGYNVFASKSEYFDKDVKAEIKKQKEAGFKKYDRANFMLANTRSLVTTYPVEAGYTYRVVSIFQLMEGTNILRVKDQNGKELVPEMRTTEKGSISSFKLSGFQSPDIPVTQNGTITLENGLMGDRTIYYAVNYIIFRKKTS